MSRGSSDRRLLLALAALAAAWALCAEAAGVSSGLWHLLPVLLVFAPLLAGRYPGEELFVRAVTRRRRPAPALSRGRAQLPRPRRASLPRGGRLLGARLAGRAPPAAMA